MPARRNKKGIVYIAWNKAMPRLVKIGVTEKCAHHRVKTISCQSVPFPFILIAQFESDKCLEFEQYCHQNLHKFSIGKEFFRIPKADAVNKVSVLASTFQHGATLVDFDPIYDGVKDMRASS